MYTVMSVITFGFRPHAAFQSPLYALRTPFTPIAPGEGKKTGALRRNPRVCVECVEDTCQMENEFSTEYESAALFGNASEVTDETEKVSAFRWPCERHTPLSMEAFDTDKGRAVNKPGIVKGRSP